MAAAGRLWALITLVALFVALATASCDDHEDCQSCQDDGGCSWCLVDGVALCFPREWEVCKAEDQSCAAFNRKARDIIDTSSAVCTPNTALCGVVGAPISPCEAAGCLVCLDGAPETWICYTPAGPDVYVGPVCEQGSNFAAVRTNVEEVCNVLIASSAQVELVLPISGLGNLDGAPVVFNFLDEALANGSVPFLHEVAGGGFQVDLNSPDVPEVFRESLLDMVADLVSQALPGGKIDRANIVIVEVTLIPRAKRDALDNYDVRVQFALLKPGDVTGFDNIAEELVENLVQGVIPGVDPISATSVPSIVPVFPTNSTTTVPPQTEEVKPRDPTSPLSGGALFGIIFGSAIALILCAAGVAYLFYRYRASHRPPFDPARAH